MKARDEAVESAWQPGGPSRTILRMLQRQGPTSVKQIKQDLGVTTNAVREQVLQLQRAGLVQVTRHSEGAGRPAHLYSLTTRGQELLSQGYDTLLNYLMEEIVSQDGAAKLTRLLDGVARRLTEKYAAENGGTDLDSKLHDVQHALEQYSIPITIVEQGDSVRLHTWGCPYVEVAAEHRVVCDMETHMFEQVLGQPVMLEQRIIDGATGCCFVTGKEAKRQPEQES